MRPTLAGMTSHLEPAIDVRELRKTYGTVEAVRDVSFEVMRGEVFCLLGPNGAGKTSVVEILEGYRTRTGGEARVLGTDPAAGARALRERVGIVLQQCGVQSDLTVTELIEMYGRYYARRRPVDEPIELVDLGAKRDTRAKHLSGGQLRRLDLALALVGDPELVFLDEPTTGFDPAARRGAWSVVRSLCELGKTVFLTTHYMDEAHYCTACAGMIATRFGMAAVLACADLAGVTSAVGGANGGQVIGWVAASLGIGMLLLVMRDLRIRNEQLGRARAELARMAVAEERERFARHLHDLLGHSLSVIALKAELARRLIPERPDEAAGEVAELEEVARGALSEVRDAVSGYRQPSLDGELAGAQMALAAAGIKADVGRQPTVLDPDIEGVLAWAVREGATNVIRHSQASHCTLTISSNLVDAGVEVLDDGPGAGRANGNAGHGLEGLTERARSLNGRVEAGPRADGGGDWLWRSRSSARDPGSDRRGPGDGAGRAGQPAWA